MSNTPQQENGCSDHKDHPQQECANCRMLQRLTNQLKAKEQEINTLEENNAEQVQQITTLEENNAEQVQQITTLEERLAKMVLKSQGGGCYIFGVSAAAKDSTRRKKFRNILPNTPYPGAFVAHDFFVAFVKAARRMNIDTASSPATAQMDAGQWPTDADWTATADKVENFAKSSGERFDYSLFPKNGRIADLEEPQSALAAELLRLAINNLQTDEASIVVSHQFTVADMVPQDKANLILADPTKVKTIAASAECKLEFKVDILAWVKNKGQGMGATAIAATEYKPDEQDEDARKTQTDMYGVNIMSLHQKLCIAVDILGGKDLSTWRVCASAIIPIPLSFNPKPLPLQRYSKSTLFQDVGANGIVGLAAGIIKAFGSMPDTANDFGQLLGPVVGYSNKTCKVTKAYDNATYRRPNIDIVRSLVDDTASMFVSEDKKLTLVETAYFESDWTQPVPFGLFGVLLEQLIWLHKTHGPHGDIRLANILRKKDSQGMQSVCLIDFDFVGQDKYPIGLQDLTEDGARHPDVANAIKGGKEVSLEIKKEHDFFSLAGVMELFKAADESKSEDWQTCTQRMKTGLTEELPELLELLNSEATVVLKDGPLAEKFTSILEFKMLAGTGATPTRERASVKK